MNNFHRPHGGVQEADAAEEAVRSPFSDLAGRFANWMTGADRLPAGETAGSEEPDIGNRADPPDPQDSPAAADQDGSARFPVAPFGYSRTAVDEYVTKLERELERLRAKQAPMASITEELERIGEQTSSILVVAHDQAQETTRMAQEQAERCVADAAANAVQITAEAKAKLRDLDAETDAVWRERERLLEDVRVVSAALANLANQASERFPAAEPTPSTGSFEAVAAPTHALWEEPEYPAQEPQATEPFNALKDDGEGEHEDETAQARPGDTGSWLVGLEPPDLQPDR
jgi:cell division septum initiation protein DivIVA